jgi:hypothetical protein
LGIPFPVLFSSHTVKFSFISPLTEIEKLMQYVTGAFWLGQGASLMPLFAVGANYSSTGNSFDGIETTGYHATAGMRRPNFKKCKSKISNRSILRCSGCGYLYLSHMFHSNKCVPVPCSIIPGGSI